MKKIELPKSFEESVKIYDNLVGDYITSNVRDYLINNGFFTAPASTKYHGAYEGGLFDHSITVAIILVELSAANQLSWHRVESPLIIGLFHDMCKIDQYKNTDVDLNNGKLIYEYNNETYFKGHGNKSIILLSSLLQLTEEEVFCIRYHMGAFTDKEEWNDYNRAIRKYNNVLWTHHADMIAAQIFGT